MMAAARSDVAAILPSLHATQPDVSSCSRTAAYPPSAPKHDDATQLLSLPERTCVAALPALIGKKPAQQLCTISADAKSMQAKQKQSTAVHLLCRKETWQEATANPDTHFSGFVSSSSLTWYDNSVFLVSRGSENVCAALGGSYSSSPGVAKFPTKAAMPVMGNAGFFFGLQLDFEKRRGGPGANNLSSFSGRPVGWPVLTDSFIILVMIDLDGRRHPPGPSMLSIAAYTSRLASRLDQQSLNETGFTWSGYVAVLSSR